MTHQLVFGARFDCGYVDILNGVFAKGLNAIGRIKTRCGRRKNIA